jgi:hypothetical protein
MGPNNYDALIPHTDAGVFGEHAFSGGGEATPEGAPPGGWTQAQGTGGEDGQKHFNYDRHPSHFGSGVQVETITHDNNGIGNVHVEEYDKKGINTPGGGFGGLSSSDKMQSDYQTTGRGANTAFRTPMEKARAVSEGANPTLAYSAAKDDTSPVSGDAGSTPIDANAGRTKVGALSESPTEATARMKSNEDMAETWSDPNLGTKKR